MIKLMQRFLATGHCRPEKFGGYKRPILAEHEEKVRALLRARPDLTISELWQELTVAGIKVGRSSVGRFVERLELTYKKRMARPVCKGIYRDRRLIGLLQRIRLRRCPPSQDGDTRAPVLIKLAASSAVF